ncbi:MAG: ankyrin repeat domain-containing protein, partial [Acidobacteriota bacterium]
MRIRTALRGLCLVVFVSSFISFGLKFTAQGTSSAKKLEKTREKKLLRAAKTGDLQAVNELLSQGTDPNAPLAVGRWTTTGAGDYLWGWTPVETAAAEGHTQVLKVLMDAGAKIQRKGIQALKERFWVPETEDGWAIQNWIRHFTKGTYRTHSTIAYLCGNALGAAAFGGHVDTVQFLVDRARISPDDREMTTEGTANGWTPLMWAALGDRPRVAELLLDRGADPNLKEFDDGYRAAHFAARRGATGVLKILIAHGADIEARDDLAETPLHLAAARNVAACLTLLEAGANVHARTEAGWTPLHLAALNGRPANCEALIKAGADVEARGKFGRTPLHLAAAEGRTEVCRALTAHGANPVVKTSAGLTPLHFAAASGDWKTVLLLYRSGGSVDARDALGYTPLHYAAWLDRQAAAGVLLLRGARVSAAGDDGFTPLHVAVLEDARNVIPALLVFHANPDMPDRKG